MKVLIIEDEKPAADKLIRMLESSQRPVEVMDVIGSIEDAINWLESHQNPELVFMDIQLDDGICFEIFDSVKVKTPVIFTTAYDEYAIKAFKVNSIDYLLKPITKDALGKALDKYSEFFENRKNRPETETIRSLFPNTHKERFFIKVGIKYKSIPTKDINCFYIRDRNVFLFTKEGKSYDLDMSLEKLEKIVDPTRFFRVNRNFMVNIDAIGDIVSYSSNRLKLHVENRKEEDIIVSRERMGDFKRWMDR